MDYLPPAVSYHIFMNNYFTSSLLFTYLGVGNIWATGVLNKNGLHKCNIVGDKQSGKKVMWQLWTAHIKQKKQWKFDSGWFEQQQKSGVHSFL